MWRAVIVGWVLLSAALVKCQSADVLVRGQPVADPEAISGRWMTGDGQGGPFGIAVWISAVTPLTGSLENGPFLLDGFQVALCRGASQSMLAGQCNFFNDGPGGGVRLGESVLEIHRPAEFAFPAVDISLQRDGNTWTGTLHRGDLFRTVRFERTAEGDLSGTWKSKTRQECLHLATMQGGVMAWRDQLVDPRLLRFAHGIALSAPREEFGRFLDVALEPSTGFAFVLAPPTVGQSLSLRPELRRLHGRRELVLTGRLPRDPANASLEWTRVRRASCRATLGHPQ